MAKFNPPKEFDFDPAGWSEWYARWSRYRTVSKLDKDEQQLQVDSFLYCMGSKSESIHNGFGLSDDDAKSYDKVTKSFEKYFTPRKYVIYERARFFRRNQQTGESVEQYVRALNEIADRCDFTNRSEQMRDRIVVGITDVSCSRDMQKMNVEELTEEVAFNMARQFEQVDRNMKDLSESAAKPGAVDAISKTHNRPKPRINRPKASRQTSTNTNSNTTPCNNCGYVTHTKGTCPAKDSKCNKCGKVGHYGKMCRSKTDHSVSQVEESGSVFLGEISDANVGVWTKTINVDKLDASVQFKLDTGADVSILPKSLCSHVMLDATKKQFVGPGNSKITVLGSFRAKLSVNDCTHTETMYVVDQTKALLSRSACVQLGLITCVCDVDSVSNATDASVFRSEYPKLFQGLGKMKQEVGIELRSDCRPFAINTPRPVPYPLLSSVKQELDDMVAKGVVSSVSEPTDWCAPMVIALKANKKVRICVDYTELNKVVRLFDKL